MSRPVLCWCDLSGSDLRRKSILKPKYRPQGYEAGFDAETLWYDAFWRDGRVWLVCPKLNNLEGPLKQADLRLDGQPARIGRIRKSHRHDVVEIPAQTCPSEITVKIGDWVGSSAVSPADLDLFAGLNAIFYVSQNNRLEWIRDHARFHKHHHGLQGLVVIDNASTDYGLADIEAALEPVGLDRVVVLSAPFKYGPVGLSPFRRREKYLQSGMFNLMRLRFLARARAVMFCDVDELIMTSGPSVFDSARGAWLGLVHLRGVWRYPAPDGTPPFLHSDHVYRDPHDNRCPPKWCINPQGPLRHFNWDTHGMEQLPFLRRRVHPDFKMLHCFNLTTGWKSGKRVKLRDGVVPDDPTVRALSVIDT